jgi:hypothetical protein
MSRRRGVKTTIGTIRSIYDQNGNYLPAGNYFFSVDKFDNNNNEFIGDIINNGNYGKFNFSPMSLIKMLAVGQSKLASEADLLHIQGMPNYPIPLNNNYVDFNNTNRIVEYYPGRHRHNFRNNVVVPTSPNNLAEEEKEKEEKEEEIMTCRICLDELCSTENNKMELECGHSFHQNCLDEWRKENNTCPICRSEVKEKTTRYLYNRILERRERQRERQREQERRHFGHS